MFCHKCGKKIDENWDFCPSCGAQVMKPLKFKRQEPSFSIDNLLKSFDKQFRNLPHQMESDMRRMEKDFEVFNLRPVSEPRMKKNGFSVSIKSGTGQKPKINIKTFGDVDPRIVQEQLERKFGIKTSALQPAGRKVEVRPRPESSAKPIPKITEEPKTDIKRLPNQIIIEIKLPEIESESDITLHTFPESIELKAIGKNKMYFKIIQIPKDWALSGKKFKDSILQLEFAPRC